MNCRKLSIGTIMLIIFLTFAFCSKVSATSITKEILRYTNDFRKSKGKPPLVMEDVINEQAQQHTKNMAQGKTPFGHQGFGERINALKTGSVFISAAAENVAYGYMSAKEVVDGWIKSPTHRKNLLGNFTHIGIGAAEGKNGNIYFTQVFIKK